MMDEENDFRPVRKELQGPRPTPLKVRKESHKINKPPVGQHVEPPPLKHHQPPQRPVIIYAVSPKVIHTNPNEFMALVQRLTGPNHSTSSSSSSSFSSSSSSSSSHHVIGAISPAARLACIGKTKMPLAAGVIEGGGEIVGIDADIVQGVERTVIFPGILSPGPGSIPPVSPNFFSPLFCEPIINLNSLPHESSTVQRVSRSFTERNYMQNPLSANLFSPSTMISPSSLEFLHQLLNS